MNPNPSVMHNHENLMNSIKENSPIVYELVKKQMAKKWEITTGMKFKTTDQTTATQSLISDHPKAK